jgi:Transposase
MTIGVSVILDGLPMHPRLPSSHRHCRLPGGWPLRVLRGSAVPGVCRRSTGLSALERRTVSKPPSRPGHRRGCLPTGISSEEADRKYAPPVLAAQLANGLTCGIDWVRDDHAIAMVDSDGHAVRRSTTEHSSAGLRELVAVLTRTKTTEVAIERPDGPVIDALLDAGITVVVISPNQPRTGR